MADSYQTVVGAGVSRALQEGVLCEADVDRLTAAGLIDQTGRGPVVNFTGRIVLYALSSWIRQRERPCGFVRDELPSLRGRRVLDVGCGEGCLVAHALQQGASLAVGVDLLSVMVRVSQAILASQVPDLWRRGMIVRGAAEAIPFDRDSFDLVSCRLAVNYFDLPRAVPEMVRVLAPDGYLYMRVVNPWYYVRRLFRSFPPKGIGESVVALANAVPTFFGRPAWRFRLMGRDSFTASLLPTAVRRWFGRYGLRAVTVVHGAAHTDAPAGRRWVGGGVFHILLKRPDKP